MIKTVNVRSQEEIDAAIAALSSEGKKQYDDLVSQFQEESSKPNPNHEVLADLTVRTNELLGLCSNNSEGRKS